MTHETLDTTSEHTHFAMLHFREQAILAPIANIPELEHRLYMSIAYTEELGGVTYDHYDVWGIRKHTS